MKKILLNIILIASLVSCSNPTDKSIMEKISNEDLKKIIEIDSSYSSIFKSVNLLNQNATQLDSVTYSEITYKMLFDYEKESSNDERWDKIKSQYAKEWDDKYGIYDEKVDSIVSYWKLKYENEKSLDRFIKVEPISISNDYYEYSGRFKDASIRFKLTNLSGKTISGATFRYKIIAKVNDDGDEGEYKPKYDGDFSYITDWNGCRSTAVFNKSTTGYWKVPYGDENKVRGETLSSLKATHNIYVVPYKVRVNNKNYEIFEYRDIPFDIRMYIENKEKGNETMTNLYKKDILNEILNLGLDIPNRNDKFYEYFDKKMSEEFPLVDKYFNQMFDKVK
jgi:hypothetical protein